MTHETDVLRGLFDAERDRLAAGPGKRPTRDVLEAFWRGELDETARLTLLASAGRDPTLRAELTAARGSTPVPNDSVAPPSSTRTLLLPVLRLTVLRPPAEPSQTLEMAAHAAHDAIVTDERLSSGDVDVRATVMPDARLVVRVRRGLTPVPNATVTVVEMTEQARAADVVHPRPAVPWHEHASTRTDAHGEANLGDARPWPRPTAGRRYAISVTIDSPPADDE